MKNEYCIWVLLYLEFTPTLQIVPYTSMLMTKTDHFDEVYKKCDLLL